MGLPLRGGVASDPKPTELTQETPRPQTEALLLGLIVIVGVVARAVDVIRRPSLSLDESFLAVNLIRRDWRDLAETLDFNQGAPVGFLWLEKGALLGFGAGETALRLVPLVAGITALLLFVPLAANVLNSTGRIVSTGVFAGSTGAILYATTAKQYSLDLLAAVVIYLVGLRLAAGQLHLSRRVTTAVAAGAGVIVWFSHASLFLLAGVLGVLGVRAALRGPIADLVKFGAIAMAACLSFAGAYAVNLRRLSGLQESLEGQSGSLVDSTFGGSSATSALTDFSRTFARATRDVLGIPQIPIGALDLGDLIFLAVMGIVLIGAISLARRRLSSALVLASPLGLLALAAGLDRYPVFPRTILFVLPVLALLVGEATSIALRRMRTRPFRLIVTGVVAVAIAALPLGFGLTDRFRDDQGVRATLSTLASTQEPGQALYVFFPTQYRLAYYRECECFGPAPIVRRAADLWPVAEGEGGREQWAEALRPSGPRVMIGGRLATDPIPQAREFSRLRGRGDVWVLMSDLTARELDVHLDALRSLGSEIRTVGEVRPRSTFAILMRFPQTEDAP